MTAARTHCADVYLRQNTLRKLEYIALFGKRRNFVRKLMEKEAARKLIVQFLGYLTVLARREFGARKYGGAQTVRYIG